ncbi:MAG: 2-oxoacid:acceptor oxidoreductase family protein [Oscillospiraceae bacterium]|jgi:2-oxoglutarate ferredoxin oxidoreductase subunit gamma|nr:2-oxoacid:acceptor oxidoreductase family protein [Oscillospiraceae bacterium]
MSLSTVTTLNKQILIAGFGGQGILFAGKFLAYEGLIEGKQVSWLPSYGPEMRGGTANCSIIISEGQIGSPIITSPDILIALNLPSLDKFENEVIPGGQIIVDSSLIERKCVRDDVKVSYIPATKLAADENLSGLANMIIIGKLIRETGVIPYENVPAAMEKVVPPAKKNLFDLNLKAIELGYNY